MSNNATAMREYPWSQVDVFAGAPLQGNMLAVFSDARGLTSEEMQAIARETNLSETTFILPRDEAMEREHGVRVRIFTTREELPFAGHPTLGTASWLRLNAPFYRGASSITLDLNGGPVTVRFAAEKQSLGVVGEMTQHDPVFGERVSAASIVGALGIHEYDIAPGPAPQVVSTGLAFLIVPLVSFEAASRLQVDHAELASVLSRCGAHFAYVIAPLRGDGGAQWHARMPFYGGEDPATGSAAGCAVSYLVGHGIVPPETLITIQQGIEVQRPSLIHVRAAIDGGVVRNVRVSGRTIPVATGRFFLP